MEKKLLFPYHMGENGGAKLLFALLLPINWYTLNFEDHHLLSAQCLPYCTVRL